MPDNLYLFLDAAFDFIVKHWIEGISSATVLYMAYWFGLRTKKRSEFNNITLETYGLLMRQVEQRTLYDHSIEPYLIVHLMDPLTRFWFERRTNKYRAAQKKTGEYVEGIFVEDERAVSIFISHAKSLACSVKPR